MKTFAHGNELTPNLIARKAEIEIWHKSFFAKWISEIIVNSKDATSGGGGKNSQLPVPETESPIVKYYNEFLQGGSDSLYVPQIRRLTNLPKYGDAQLKGFEENMSTYLHRVYVNRFRTAVNTTIGKMNDLRARRIKMAQQAVPGLKAWLSAYITPYVIMKAFNEGYSDSITRSAANDGLAIAKMYNPNTYVRAGSATDWVTWSATPATHLRNIATAIHAQSAAVTDANRFSAEMLEDLRGMLIAQRVGRLVSLEGKEYWAIICHPSVIKQARQDTRISTATESAFRGSMRKDPILSGAELYYNGFAIFENLGVGQEVHYGDSTGAGDGNYDQLMWGAVSGLSNAEGAAVVTPLVELNQMVYTQSTTNISERKMKSSLVLGPRALSIGQAQRAQMYNETDDYDNKKSVDIDIIQAAARVDFTDAVTYTASENTSSAMIITHSP